MRTLAYLAVPLVALAAIASPAAAQFVPQPALAIPQPDPGLMAFQEMQRQQLVQQQNQIMSLEAQLRTQQNLADVRAMAVSPRLPPPNLNGKAPPPQIDTNQLASIPDSALADSNRKVLDAAGNRR